ncbi:MAG: hypothetical protein L3J28_08990 [Candidatus Polarisedimenticolaceae bacterium]|nr:hypothetical protein [Candidatus Polarisedimenticolaceae bacterium]
MVKIKTTYLLLILLSSSLLATTLYAAPEPSAEQQRIDNISSIKSDILLLHRDLSTLEQEILYPLLSQFSIYLSATDKLPFKTGQLTIKLDGQTITTQHYSTKSIQALFDDGIQHLYVGKIKQGEHQLRLIYSWQNSKNITLKGEVTHHFNKEFQAKRLELTMVEKSSKHPFFIKVIEWE